MESKYLIFLFIQRLPKILRMELGDDLDLNLRDISEKADRLWSIHTHDMAASVAAMTAAVSADRESDQASEPVAAADRQSSGLCRFHWKWGEEAYSMATVSLISALHGYC